MKSNKGKLCQLIDAVISACIENIQEDGEGNHRFVDPIEKCEISAHYGASHLAASLLMLGKLNNRIEYYSQGRDLLYSIASRWDKEHLFPAYHFDFNNFAFVICHDWLDDNDSVLKKQIRDIVIKSPDSNHETINWLPMRQYVNQRRFDWTKDNKYSKQADICRILIDKATNEDGSIEDRLPKGVSFNLQYDISTLATLFLNRKSNEGYDFRRGLAFLINCISPDGDINYQGRGCNQIFAWGPWIYLLASNGLRKETSIALDFLSQKVPVMLANNNMMLNEWNGEEQYLWWDYHYASVYTAHLALWLILAYIDFSENESTLPLQTVSTVSGIETIKTGNYCASVFNGRNEYLAERGPSINLIWTASAGIITKGCFGPWRGLFGNIHTFEDVVMLNYCGLISSYIPPKPTIISKIKRKLSPLFPQKDILKKNPIFCPIEVMEEEKSLTITWNAQKKVNAIFNIPLLTDSAEMSLHVDGNHIPIFHIANIRNQYGWVRIFQSHPFNGQKWKLFIKCI